MSSYSSVFLLLLCEVVGLVLMQGTGSGTNGNLRLCVVEGRGKFKPAQKYCPILDKENSGVECVLGDDRLDCLRRISKGTVDFGVFSPEDLVAAQWANIDVLVTNELRVKDKPFQRNIVALVNRHILPDISSTIHAVLQNSTLCHSGVGIEDIHPLSDTLSGYLESLVMVKNCDPELTLTENRIKGLAGYFRSACKAGPWVPDKARDAELKKQYPSLCAACRYPSQCAATDPYWGDFGALSCLSEGAGDVAWAELDDIHAHFGQTPEQKKNFPSTYSSSKPLAYLCRDGTWQPLENNSDPCIWLHRPWNVIVAKRKAAEAVGKLASNLVDGSVLSGGHWLKALADLLDMPGQLPTSLQPPQPPMDYLARAKGFREAYTQTGCDPPRYITLCTDTLLAKNKCEWLSEAGAVYGVGPPLQCVARDQPEACLRAVVAAEADIAIADSNWLVPALRDYNLTPILHEATPIVEKLHTVVAYVRSDSGINKFADLRGRRAAFPVHDGVAWNAVREYFVRNESVSCSEMHDGYFKEVCAPGITSSNPNYKSCYAEGEVGPLEYLVSGKSDVAFVSLSTFKAVAGDIDNRAEDFKNIVPLCPENNKMYCFLAWSNIGHVYAAKNATNMRKLEIVNVFTKLDQMFGKNPANKRPMITLYGFYNHQRDVIFHNDTKVLASNNIFAMHPYNKLPFNFETQFMNVTSFVCDFGPKTTPSLILILSLVSALFLGLV